MNPNQQALETLRTAVSEKLAAVPWGEKITIGEIRRRNDTKTKEMFREQFAFEIRLHRRRIGHVAIRRGFRAPEFYLRDEGAGHGELQPNFTEAGSGGMNPRGINFASARDVDRVAKRFAKYMVKMQPKKRGYC